MNTCGNCQFSFSQKSPDGKDSGLFCRRYPPSPLVMPAPSTIQNPRGFGIAVGSYFPIITPEQWCGEFLIKNTGALQ